MRQTIQRARSQIGQRDVGVIAGRREHGKTLNMDIGNIPFAGQRVSTNNMGKGMKDQISIFAGCLGLSPDVGADLDRMVRQFVEQLEEVMSGVVHPAAKFFWITSQGHKFNSMFFDQTLESPRRCKLDGMSRFLKPSRQRQKRLDIAARAIGEDGDSHASILPVTTCYTDKNHLEETTMTRIGILHPGEMGSSIAAAAIHNGHQVYWVAQDRGPKTRARAEKHQLTEADSLSQLCQMSEVILSICPPHAAEEVARSVVVAGFKGLYLDANAISPQRAIRIGEMLEAKAIRFVDGGIIGGPAWRPRETWLYLSGEHADQIAACFSRGPLETRIIGNEIGRASALKMCYAAYTKGSTALLAAVLATSEALGVREGLYRQWDWDENGFSEQVNRRMTRVTAKAWRFEGEMHEIASTFHDAGIPDGFHMAAAEVYRRMADFKDAAEMPPLEDVLKALLTR